MTKLPITTSLPYNKQCTI